MKRAGYIHIYWGDGKGKTTCAVGLAVRAAGSGYPVLFYQLMKDNTSGERKVLEQINNMFLMDGLSAEKFSFQMSEQEKQERREYYQNRLEEIKTIVAQRQVRLLVLDEALYAVGAKLLDLEYLIRFLEQKPEKLEVVLTGNHFDEKLFAKADYVSEIRKQKHPFDAGQKARKGIEY